MKLKDINKRLEELIPVLTEAYKKEQAAEERYWRKYYQALLQSGMGTVDAKKAEAKMMCDAAGLTDPYLDAQLEVKTLENEKYLLIEIGRNLRSVDKE